MADLKTNRRKLQAAGPLDWKGSKWIARLRSEFLRAALELEPEMGNGLRELLQLRMANTPDAAYMAALIAWGSRYNLITDRWCRERLQDALQCSHRFALDHADAEPQVLTYVATFYLPAVYFDGPLLVEGPPLPALTWNPFELTRETMEQRYKRYLDSVEAAYQHVGYKPAPERRQPDHFWWLAGYQCCGWSRNAIAQAEKIDRAAVERAIQRASKDIGLTLRPPSEYEPAWTPERIRAAYPL